VYEVRPHIFAKREAFVTKLKKKKTRNHLTCNKPQPASIFYPKPSGVEPQHPVSCLHPNSLDYPSMISSHLIHFTQTLSNHTIQFHPDSHHHKPTQPHCPHPAWGLFTPHFFKHDSGPQFEPVPTGGILDLTSSLARSCPNAALTSSNGNPFVKTWPMFIVPASSESRAETSWALSQPIHVKISQSLMYTHLNAIVDLSRKKKVDFHVPVFIIMCIEPCGKIVPWPGMSTCVTRRAPFSSYMYVVVLPCMATT